MNTRQAKLISELKNQFELLNERNGVKSTLIDIASIRQYIYESKHMRQEIEYHNDIIMNELRLDFVNKLKQVKSELESIGIHCKLRDDEYPNLHVGMRMIDGLLYSSDDSFYISYYIGKLRYDLSDGGYIEKVIGLNIHMIHGEYFDSVDELVKTEGFINKIKKLAR